MAANPRAEAARRRNEKILARGSDRLAAITGSLKPTPSSSAPVESKAEPARQGPSEELLTNAAAVRDTDAHGEGTNRGGLGDGSCVTAGVKAHGAGVRKDPSNQEPSQGVRLRAHAGGKAMLANAAKEALLCVSAVSCTMAVAGSLVNVYLLIKELIWLFSPGPGSSCRRQPQSPRSS